jgi:hypothetical protein
MARRTTNMQPSRKSLRAPNQVGRGSVHVSVLVQCAVVTADPLRAAPPAPGRAGWRRRPGRSLTAWSLRRHSNKRRRYGPMGTAMAAERRHEAALAVTGLTVCKGRPISGTLPAI